MSSVSSAKDDSLSTPQPVPARKRAAIKRKPKEPTVSCSDPPLHGLFFAEETKPMDRLLEKQSESDKEEGFQGNLGSLVGWVLFCFVCL